MQGERIGPYRLEAKLGVGGMGEVYKAYDERLDRWVALKRISADRSRDAVQRERLLREARASARLSHPAIVQVFDLLQGERTDCIIMELVEGKPLSLLLRQGPLEPPQALALAREIMEALIVAHAHGIVHRDLKAENVIVTPDGHAKVLDFGISKRLGAGEDEPSLTGAGIVMGTLRTMAPEQAQGKEVDHRADLFSFGVLLYEMLSGRSPFQAPNATVALHRLCYDRHTPLSKLDPHLPHSLSLLVDHLLEKKPELRPESAREVAAALAAISGEPYHRPADTSATLLEMPRVSVAEPAFRSSATAERRRVTVLSCGLVRASGGPSDPEEIIEAMPRLQIAAVLAARRFEGRVAPGTGEDCRVFFGDLQAHEDDARRAVYTALEIVSRCCDWKDGFAVRIGIHTGAMVVARAAAPEAALGDTPGIATVLKTLADARTVLVSESTFRQIEGYFECEELTSVAMRGRPQPLQVYRVVAEREAHTRIQEAGALTPLVAREQELNLLLARWDLAREGRGQVVLVSGEAGVGKSRLVWELRQRVQASGAQWLEGHGSPFHRDSPLYPVAQWLDQWIGADRSDPPEVRLERLAEALSRHGLAPEAVPLLAALLSLPADERFPLPPLSPEAQRRKTLEALLTLLLTTAERRPLLLAVEDLHWVDPSTLELLGSLAAQAEAVALLLMLTFRPEFEPPWEQRSSVTRLGLGLLTRSQAGLMIDRLTTDRRLAPALREQIVVRTDGVPLFIEEMTKMLLDSTGQGEVPRTTVEMPLEVPGTLEGWLMARLDRLGTAKDVAQLAATLGREFSRELLRAVSPWSEDELGRELDRLVHAELLFRRGLPPRERYVFKHALLQDAAYASLLKSDRQRHHQRIAEILQEQFPEVAASQPELLAHHYTAGAMPEQAVPQWQRAGERAIQASAYLEAIGHLERAVGLLAELPESPERDEREISLQVALGVAKAATESYASPAVHDAYSRALELCQRVGQTPQLFPALRGLYVYHLMSAQQFKAVETAEQLLEMAEREGSPAFHTVSHQSMGLARLMTGDLEESRSHLEAMLCSGLAENSATDLSLPGAGAPLLEGMANLTWTLWHLGYPDQALRRSRETVALARRLAAPFTVCFVDFFAADLHVLRGEPEEARPLAEHCMAIAVEQSLQIFVPMSGSQLGWVEAERGNAAAGIEKMREGLEARLAAGAAGAATATHATLLAEHLLRADLPAEALAAIERAFVTAEDGQRIMNAELHRLKGELLQRLGAAEDEAEEEFHRALDLARRQGARSLELRAAMSLARLWRRQGKTTTARDLLAPVYEWFTEGLDTRDLREARSLLAELG